MYRLPYPIANKSVHTKVFTRRCSHEGVHTKVFTRRCSHEGVHTKVFTRRCSHEGYERNRVRTGPGAHIGRRWLTAAAAGRWRGIRRGEHDGRRYEAGRWDEGESRRVRGRRGFCGREVRAGGRGADPDSGLGFLAL